MAELLTKNDQALSPEGVWRLVRGVGGNYWARNQAGVVYQVQARGVFRDLGIKPIPGDLIHCEATFDELIPLRMTEILERKNELPRPPLSNLEALWLIIPLAEPEPDLWMLDKMLVIAADRDIPVRIIFTKDDLVEESPVPDIYERIGYPVNVSSLENQALIDALRLDIGSGLVALAGPSGAGKSTMLNRILGGDYMETGKISQKLGRGKQTTRHAELFPLGEGYLADTPGFSSLDLGQAGVTEEVLVRSYPEIWQRQNDCRFLSCKHLTEPDCQVRLDETIDPGRLLRYQTFRMQVEGYRDYERKQDK